MCVCGFTEYKLITIYCKLRADITCHSACQVLVTINEYLKWIFPQKINLLLF